MAGCVAYCLKSAKGVACLVYECSAAGAFMTVQIVVQVARCVFGERFCRNFHLALAWGWACVADIRLKIAVWRLGNIEVEKNTLAQENAKLKKKLKTLEGASKALVKMSSQNELLKKMGEADGIEKRLMSAQIALSDEQVRRLQAQLKELEEQLGKAKEDAHQLREGRDIDQSKIKKLQCQVILLSGEGQETAFKAACLKTFEAIAKILPQLVQKKPDERVKPLMEARGVLEKQFDELFTFLKDNYLKLAQTDESRVVLADMSWCLKSMTPLFTVSDLVIGGIQV